ncbi:NADH dehydrogenase [bacterium HR36]|nr:NADH dehydrogenase [bacterium HR36]
MLYQVATAALSPADIAAPIRSIFRRCPTASIVFDEVIAVNPHRREVLCRRSGAIGYDFLMLAPGSCPNYFGHDHWQQFALPLKTLRDALELRRRILEAYELAASCPDPEAARAYTTFVVIGGGPTGVELAGALAEIGRFTMVQDFPHLRPEDIRVVLLEAGERLLPSFPPSLSARALRDLEELGVHVRLGVRASDVRPTGVMLSTGEFLAARTVIWAAGTRAPSFLQSLGVPLDRNGRVVVALDCSVPGFPEIFVIGDAACFRDERYGELPQLAPVALQQGRFVARILRKRLPHTNALPSATAIKASWRPSGEPAPWQRCRRSSTSGASWHGCSGL